VSTLVVRAYARGDDAQRERALDVIDTLLQNQAYGLNEALEGLER
jgi:hypothetical protein